MPISNNDCLTIINTIDLKDNLEFIEIFFENLKNQSNTYKISINKENYNVCINQKNKEIIEKEILKYVELKTEIEFNKFIYAQ